MQGCVCGCVHACVYSCTYNVVTTIICVSFAKRGHFIGSSLAVPHNSKGLLGSDLVLVTIGFRLK